MKMSSECHVSSVIYKITHAMNGDNKRKVGDIIYWFTKSSCLLTLIFQKKFIPTYAMWKINKINCKWNNQLINRH